MFIFYEIDAYFLAGSLAEDPASHEISHESI